MMARVRTLFFVFCVTLLAFSVRPLAQSRTHRPPPPPNTDASRQTSGDALDRDNSPANFGSPRDEMLDRAAIKFDEQEHKDTLERAREGAQLGVELRADFEQNKTLTREDWKKIERLEKIARRIRSRAGGSDDESPLEDPPRNLESAIPRLAKVAEELQKGVEKTTRHVVSAAVIERSNELIELIRYVRGSLSR